MAAGYLVTAAVLFTRARTCAGWACDLVALPVVFPFGFPIAWLIDVLAIPGYPATPNLRVGYFIVPTMLANACFYFGLGRAIERLADRLQRNHSLTPK